MTNSSYFVIFFIALSISSCKSKTDNLQSYGGTYLKDLYKGDFKIGAALNAGQILGRDSLALPLIPREFNTITPENIMKCEVIHPEWNRYNFDLSDKIVDLSAKNKMFLVGHTLIWHSQLSPFVRRIKSPDSLKMFMKEHISTITSRYKGKINGWDVVNEALEEDGTMRKSIFYNLLGDDYIVEAFRLAQAADPKCELYYNDYNIEQPKKRAGAIEIIKKIQKAGVRIDGVGIQGHWSIRGLPFKDIEESIKEFSALGIKVMFTELDITVLPNPWDLRGADVNQNFESKPEMNPYPKSLPDSVQVALANQYGTLFELFLKYKDNVDRVTFWGVADGNSWLNGWPIRGRTNYPLLFDRNYKPKPAYYRVSSLKKLNKGA